MFKYIVISILFIVPYNSLKSMMEYPLIWQKIPNQTQEPQPTTASTKSTKNKKKFIIPTPILGINKLNLTVRYKFTIPQPDPVIRKRIREADKRIKENSKKRKIADSNNQEDMTIQKNKNIC